MQIEVDMSGRIDRSSVDTVLAYSNKIHYAILIPTLVKRELYRSFHQQKQEKKKITFKLKLFSISLFYLLGNRLSNFMRVTIDKEFEGHEKDILSMLFNIMRKENLDFDKDIIKFGLIGKKSKAHEIAIKVYKNIIKENKILTREDFEKYL